MNGGNQFGEIINLNVGGTRYLTTLIFPKNYLISLFFLQFQYF